MIEEKIASWLKVRAGVATAYMKLIIAALVGAALVFGIYFFVIKGNTTDAGLNPAAVLCTCPNCGMTVNKPRKLDCEEVNCPHCGNAMSEAAVLAAARQRAFTPERRERPERVWPPPAAEQQRVRAAPQFTPAALPAMGSTGTCVCPNCGRNIARHPGTTCRHNRCPHCQIPLTNAIFVGPVGNPVGVQGPQLAATPPYRVAAPYLAQAAAGTTTGGMTYSNSIQGIITVNCQRCHSGPIRTLNNYSQVKAYVDNGLLMMMVQPGGPMSRFLSASEANQIIDWIKSGAPQ